MNSPRTVRWTFVLTVVSMALNLALAAVILHARRAPGGMSEPAASAKNSSSLPLWNQARMRERTAITYVTNAPLSAPLHWAELESRDYKQYAARLRAAGVPEQVVRDIITADVGKAFGARAIAIRGPNRETKFWQRYRPPELATEQKAQSKKLDDERQAALKEILGQEISSQSVVDLLFMQVRGDALQTGFLPDDKRDAARAAIERADRQVDWDDDEQAYLRRESDRQRLRMAELAKVLTPEELDDYRLRNSPSANAVRGTLRDFQISPEEFRAIVEVKDSLDKELGSRANYQKRQKREAEELAKALGAERYAEYARETDDAWVNARQIAEREGLNPEVADKVFALKQSTDAALERIRANKTFDATQRQTQIEAAKAAAEQNVRAALGESAFKRYKNRGGMWIGNIR